ncbi:MAG: glycyl-radical enzyme activating protein [Acidobacteria bacterium]|nr:MAG: glycyl-radical enzyme activating protein [Acidobacteriota bacterium]
MRGSGKQAITGLITNIQRYSLQDGPGIRTTVFFKGCPLDCWWCHNPEGLSRRREVVTIANRCQQCGECIKACPEGVAQPGSSPAGSVCVRCGACIGACPTGARQFAGMTMTVDDVLWEIDRDRIFHDDSSGGVTFSGGEPLLQPEFLLALLHGCRHSGVRTAVDTCGFVNESTLLEVAAHADLILFDVKLLDDSKHRKFTGVSNAVILANLRRLCGRHPEVWLRVPVIPTVNDSPEDLEDMARFAASLSGIRQVSLLPYHRTGIQKFERLGREYRLPAIIPPSAAEMKAAADCFQAHGLKVKVGG